MSQLPTLNVSYIKSVDNAKENNNCRFRAIVIILGYNKDR